jgi:hypothetical protein
VVENYYNCGNTLLRGDDASGAPTMGSSGQIVSVVAMTFPCTKAPWYKRRWPEPSSSFPRPLVPILYRQAGRGGILGVLVIVFSVTYRTARPVERTIPSLATTF